MAIVPLPSTPRARVPPALARSTTTLFSHRFPPRSPPRSPRAIPHDPSRPFIVISTRCRGRSRRVTRMRSRAGAVKRPRASSSRARCAPSDDDDDERGRRGGRRRETPPRVARAGSFARPGRPRASSHIRIIHPRRARARGRAGHHFDASSVVHRPSSSRRVASVKKKTGARRVPRSLSSRVRSFARARATMWRATTARGAACRRSRPGPSLRFIFIRARGYRVEACVKSMYVCEWFDTVKRKKTMPTSGLCSVRSVRGGGLFWGRGGL